MTISVNKNAMTRYKILDELLSSRYHNYTLDELANEVVVRLSYHKCDDSTELDCIRNYELRQGDVSPGV